METNKKNNNELKDNKKDKKKKKNIEYFEKEINELKDKLKESKENYLRLLADFDNYRKRVNKEILEAKDAGKIELVNEIIPILDNLELSLKMKDTNPQLIIKGVEMILKNMFDILKKHNFEIYEPKILEEFNAELHEPLLIEDKNGEEGKILDVVSKGYKFKEKVIRPSKVKIKKIEEK